MFLVNGESKRDIDINDRGFLYGDGLFETIEICNGRPVFFHAHLARLKKGCEKLFIPFPEPDLLIKEVHSLLRTTSLGVLKLIISRGTSGRGYCRPETCEPTRVLIIHPYPNYPDNLRTEGIVARFCHHQLGHNKVLAGLKHLNRLEQILARSEWRDNNIREGLMRDNLGHIIEGTMSNLFLVKQGVLYTPKLDLCGVAGIIRGLVIKAAELYKVPLRQTDITRRDILQADELFVTNSLILVWPIRRIGRHHFDLGPITRQVNAWVHEYKQQDTSHAE